MTMSVGPTTTTQTTSQATSATSSSSSSGGTVSQADFMQLLVAQLQNHDPTQPVQGTEFVTQLAQFAQLQQSTSQTQMLGTLSTQLTGLSNNQATDLVGQTVTVSGNTVSFDGTTATPTNVTLASAAANVTATISDSNGNVVQTLNLGAHAAGSMGIPWNGQDSAGGLVPSGNYTVTVTATDASNQAVSVSQNVTGVVQNVSFSQGYPELTLTSGVQAPISQLVSVGAPATSP
jgi:flagellar basal-body rod modification protein FlgD